MDDQPAPVTAGNAKASRATAPPKDTTAATIRAHRFRTDYSFPSAAPCGSIPTAGWPTDHGVHDPV